MTGSAQISKPNLSPSSIEIIMIKIISYDVITMAFPTGRQISYVGDSDILQDPAGTEACITATVLWPGAVIKISVVSQCRVLVPVMFMNTQFLGALVFTLTTCTCWTA